MEENVINYTSIEEIHSSLVRREFSPRKLYDYLRENEEAVRGSETEYHNLSVEFSKQNCSSFAADVAAMGTKVYPMSTELLPAMVKYAQESGNDAYCKIGLERLNNIPRKYWTWRTFTFVIDYYKDSLCSVQNIGEYAQNVDAAKEIIAEYKKYMPHDEHAYIAEAEMYLQQNDRPEAIAVLDSGVQNVPVAPQCCMKLAELYLEEGEYNKVEEYAQKGILASSQEQPSVSIGYLYYLLALSMDAQRMTSRIKEQLYDSSKTEKIIAAYQTADRLFVNEGRKYVSYRGTIKAKLIIISMEEKIQIDAEQHE